MGPAAMKTKVGWVLSGPACQASTSQAASTNLLQVMCILKPLGLHDRSSSKLKDPLVQQLRKFWEIELIGVSLDEGQYTINFLILLSRGMRGMKYACPGGSSVPYSLTILISHVTSYDFASKASKVPQATC